MTQEEKELLLQDLCGRLPYGVKMWYKYFQPTTFVPFATSIRLAEVKVALSRFLHKEGDWFPIIEADELLIKPYLRTLSSMTEEEAFEMFNTVAHQVSPIGVDIESDRFRFKTVDGDGNFAGHTVLFFDKIYSLKQFDWLNKKMFDYRGLIEKGLALEAPEDMYRN